MLRYLHILILISIALIAKGQEEGFGLIINDETDEQYANTPLVDTSRKKLTLPAKVSLRQHSPTPKDQQTTAACVPWSVAYGAYTIAMAAQNGWTHQRHQRLIDSRALSSKYVYFPFVKDSENCNKGLSFNMVFEYLKNYGSCYQRNYNFGKSACYEPAPSEKLQQEAKRNRISGYKKLFHKGCTSEAQTVERLKRTLFHKNPIIVGLQVPIADYRATRLTKVLGKPSDDKRGNHAVVIVGYDDRKGAFEVMDSRGTQWGDGGFWWLKYENIHDYIVYAYQLELPTRSKGLNSSFSLVGVSDNQDLQVPFRFNAFDNTYVIAKNDWQRPIEFRLLMENLHHKSYVYVLEYSERYKEFSIDIPSSVANTHHAEVEGAAIFSPTDALDYYYYEFEKNSYTDYLIMLYTYQPIDIQKVTKALNECPDVTIYHRLLSVFQKELVTQVTYPKTNRIGCEVPYFKPIEGNVIPIILKFQ